MMTRTALTLLIAAFSVTAMAQTAVAPKKEIAMSKDKKLGWTPTANLGVNLSFSSSEGVVGQTDGNSQTYGVNFQGAFNHRTESDEWRNTLSIVEATTSTPSIPRFIKSGDDLKFSTIYLYSIPSAPKFGPYVKGDIQTSLFKGEDVRESDVTYQIQSNDGQTRTMTASTLRLTDSLKPLTTKESVGAFWHALDQKKLKLEVRLGAGALQVNASGQYAVTGTDPSGHILVNELKDVNQLGLEAGVGLTGQINDHSNYEVSAESLTPFVSNKPSGDRRDALRLTNVEANIKLTSKITTWASFGYDYKLKIEPQLVDRAQQIHLLVMNINYDLL